jgi:hypothetical protein
MQLLSLYQVRVAVPKSVVQIIPVDSVVQLAGKNSGERHVDPILLCVNRALVKRLRSARPANTVPMSASMTIMQRIKMVDFMS